MQIFTIYNNILGFLFPQKCLNCGAFGDVICDGCRQKLLLDSKHYCHVCKEEIPIELLKHKNCESFLDGVIVCYKYNKLVEKLIAEIKYKQYHSLVKDLAQLMEKSRSLRKLSFRNCIFTDVPLHRKRLWTRGFNQSKLISKNLSMKYKRPFTPLLKRVRNTKTQVGMKRVERIKNLDDAFGLTAGVRLDQSIETIILVDDVMTTGTTLEKCAEVMKNEFLDIKVVGLVFARG